MENVHTDVRMKRVKRPYNWFRVTFLGQLNVN